MGKYRQESESNLRDDAWTGDAVLSLYLRSLLLQNKVEPAGLRTEVFKYFSSNAFLNSFGRPTAMEAEIGAIYQSEGISAAFSFIEGKYLAIIRLQLQNRLFSSQRILLTSNVQSPGSRASAFVAP